MQTALTACFSISLEVFLMNTLDRLVSNPLGALAVLTLAAFLEAWGDSFFQAGFYRSSGFGRVLTLLAGAVVLAAYGSVVNVPRWDFGKLLGVYVVLFFVMAQILARVRFGQSPTLPIYTGGGLILAGGLVIAFWKG
jgi:small multidrug resistance family-3 protein